MIRMPSRSFRGPLPPLTQEQAALRDALRRDVTTLGGDIGERNVFLPAKLAAAAQFIETAFASAGYKVTRQSYTADGEVCHNLEVEVPGATRRDEIVVIGAHYDSVAGSPGANDNGSGVAALLALARDWGGRKPDRTLRFVAFVNEEPPFFQTAQMGSLVYAKACRERGERIVAMISLECIGYYSDDAGSQKYPPPVGLFYPRRGDFIGFVSNVRNRKLLRRCVATFRRSAQFPCEGGALPGWLPGIGWSDHWAFWQAGYPALMVTDTAPFRYPHYHSAEDAPDRLDYDRLARVVAGFDKLIEDLANQ
jgi:Zn-dependent M28 family amino/carboxypeptidase